MATTRKSTLQQTLDVDLNSLKADVNVKAFSCDVTGRYAVLGDSGGLLLVDLEYPYQRPRIFHHQSKSGVDCLRWNPHVSHQDHVASTSEASVLVWRVDNDYRPLMAGLRKHTGPVNDLAWAPDLPHVLATAGEDGAIHLWDVRSHQSPCQSFSAGPNRPAHLLAWNKLSPNALASAHDHEVWLWDTRKGPSSSSSSSSSSDYFATTTSSSSNNNRTSDADCSIQSLGWNPTRQSELVVSGKDGGVTFWEIDNLAAWSSSESTSSSSSLGSLDVRETVELYVPEEQPKLVHWTPFGSSGMVSVGKMKGSVSSAASSSSLSSLSSPRLDTLYLWSFPPSASTKPRAADSLQLVQRFEGHKALILAVEWRVVDGLVFQLVSLDAAGHLRLWRVEPWMLRACGHATGTTARAEAAAAAAAAAMTAGGGGSKEMGASSSSSVNKKQTSNRSLSQSMAAKLTLGALKTEVARPVSHHHQQHTPAVPPRPSPFSSTHAAASVWQEMIEVEDMARRGELTEVDIEMIDSMARTMRLSLGPVQIRPPGAVAVGVVGRGGGGGGGAKSGSGTASPRPPRSPSSGVGQGGEEPKTPGRGASSTSTASTSSSPRHEEESEGEGEGEGGDEEKEGESIRLLVTVRFPPAYPFGAMPQFQFRAVRDVEDDDEEEDEDEEGDKDEDEEEEEDLQGDDSSSSGNRGKRSSSSRKNATPKKKKNDDSAEEDEEQSDKSGEREDDDENLFLEGEEDPPTSKASKTHRRASSTSSAAGSGLLSQVGRDMLRREVEDVARLALEAQRPCLELCIRHLQKTLVEAAEAGLLLTAVGAVAGGGDGTAAAGGGGDGSLAMRKTATGAEGLQVPASPSSMPEGSKALMSKVQRDQLLPCPRYSGAVFTGQGILLCLNCHFATRSQTTTVPPPPPLKKTESGSKKKAAASPAAAVAAASKQQQRPPRTYAALLQRHRTAAGIIRKGFLSAAETPPSRAGGPVRDGLSARGGGGVGRALFPGGDLMSPTERGSSLFMELREEDEDEDDEEEEEEGEEEEARINDDDDDENEDEDGDWSSGEEEDEDKERQMSASASALYASYFQSPQSRLPINHPDHEYSFHFQEDDPSMDGLGLSVGGRPGMVSLVGGGTAPAAFTTMVTLVDFSHALPGSSILAAALRLGPSEDDKAAAFGSGTVVICFEPTSPPPSRHGSEKGSPALHRSPLSSKQGGGNTGKRRGTSELQLSLLGRGVSAGNNSNYNNTPASPRLLQHPGTRSPSSHLRRQAALAQAHGHAEQHHVSFATTGRSPSKNTTSSHGLRRLASEAELRSALKPSLVRGQSGSGDGASSSLSASKVALRRHNSLSQQERGSSSLSIVVPSASTSSSSYFSSSPAAAVVTPRSHLHRLHYHTSGAPSSSTHHQGFGREATAPLSRVRKLAGAMKREGSFLSALSLLSGGGGGGGGDSTSAGESGSRSPSAAMVGPPSLPSRSASAGSGGEGEHHPYYLGTSPATSSSLLGTSPAGRPFLVPPLRPSITIGGNTFLDASGHSHGSGGSGGGGGGAALMMSSASSSSTGGAHAHHYHYRQQASFSPSSPWGPLARQITEAREISELCRMNAEVMDRYGGANRAELVKLWSMLFLSTSACLDALCAEATRLFKGNNSNTSSGVGGGGGRQSQQQQQQQATVVASSERLRPWAEGPLGRPLVEKLLDLYEKEGDVQTLATIVCVLDVKHPYTLLRASKRKDYDRYLLAYAELLYRWGALETRTEVLKRLSSFSSCSSSTAAKGTKAGGGEGSKKDKANEMMVIAIRCQACGAADCGVERGNGVCRQCKAFAFRCVVCELAVKGQSMFCLNCSHGGHTPHMYQWFRENDVCPSGCGCRCVFSQSCDIGDNSEGQQHVQQQPQQNDGGGKGGGGGRMWG